MSRKITKGRLVGLFIALLVAFLGLQGLNAMSKPASELGVTDGKLAACPNKPNCVLSQLSEGDHAIEPLRFEDDAGAAWKRLRQVVDSLPRTKVVSEEDGYLYCEFRTAIMRYVDDVEFLLDAKNGKIDFRSASRIGYSDMGANRKRMESIRRKFSDG